MDAVRCLKELGFQQAKFDKGRLYLSTFRYGQFVSFKLIQRENYTTFYKESSQGGLLIFELSKTDSDYDAYSPLWLFGIWNLKLSFKPKPMPWARYLKEGFELEERFKNCLNK